jgi:hypothetical protein
MRAVDSVGRSAFAVPARRIELGLLALSLGALGSRFLPAEHGALAAIKLVLPALAIGLVPGFLLMLAAWPRARFTLLEVAGVGIALSLPAVQAISMLSLGLHVSVATIATLWAGISAAAAVTLLMRDWRRVEWALELDRREASLGLLLLAVAILLYLKGAPFLGYDNQSHAGIVRRLAAMPHPAIDDFYHVPNLVYTYPFPGTHFVMALISGLGGLDALFVYHKMRFFWGFAALLFVYLLARRIFESSLLSFLTGLTAAVFVLGGGFADAPGIDWGQLAPLSHPSDVAMNVLLPGLMLLACCCLQGEGRREAGFFLGATLAMGTMVAMVQIRGIVQFLVYLGCFFAGLLLYRRDRVYLVRTVTLIVGSVVVTVAYLWFHRRAAVLIAPMVAAFRAELLATARSLTLAGWFSRPVRFVSEFQWIFFGWHPLILAMGPLVWVALRRKALMLMVGISIVVYLLVIRLPLLSLPFAYVTHWEILVFPLRNLAIFTYLLAGPTLYALAVNLARIQRATIALASTALASACLVVILSRSAEFFGKHRDVYFVSVVALYILALTSLRSPRAGVWADRLLPESPRPIWKWTFALLVVPLALWTAPARSGAWSIGSTHTGVNVFPDSHQVVLTPRALFESLECIATEKVGLAVNTPDGSYLTLPATGESCPVPYALAKWAGRSLDPQAVVFANAFNVYAPSMFIPQHVYAGLPNRIGIVNLHAMSPVYSDWVSRVLRKHRATPFFNDAESIEERAAWLARLGVSHVILDPMYYARLKPELSRVPDLFRSLYDDGRWAVYEVRAQSAGPKPVPGRGSGAS